VSKDIIYYISVGSFLHYYGMSLHLYILGLLDTEGEGIAYL